MADSLNIFERVAETIKEERAAAYIDNPRSTKYFKISESTEQREIGKKYPQTKDINLTCAHSLKFDKLSDTPLSFGKIEIHKSSIITDCISTAAISAYAFILSKKAIDVFKQFDLGTYKIYPATVIHSGTGYEYGVLHFINDLHSKLDFGNSKFYVADILGGYRFDIDILDDQDYEAKRQRVKNGLYPQTEKWWSVKLKLGKFLDDIYTPDMFAIFSSSTLPYVSNQFALAILENKLTGFKLEYVVDLSD